jgi:hypothetical protein
VFDRFFTSCLRMCHGRRGGEPLCHSARVVSREFNGFDFDGEEWRAGFVMETQLALAGRLIDQGSVLERDEGSEVG